MISFRLYYLAKDPLSKQGLHSEDEGLSHQLRELGQHSSTHNAQKGICFLSSECSAPA